MRMPAWAAIALLLASGPRPGAAADGAGSRSVVAGRADPAGQLGRLAGVGAGIRVSFMNHRSAFSAGIAHCKEDDLFNVTGGFTF